MRATVFEIVGGFWPTPLLVKGVGSKRLGKGRVKKNGACLQRNCEYVHLNRFATYLETSNFA